MNINNFDDTFYRYKRPKFNIKHIGKGNKKRTILYNINDICISINRTIEEVLKFYSYSLGTSYKLIENNYTLKGEFDIKILDDYLFDYITQFILCSICNLPDTFYKIKKTKIKKICSACGQIDIINADDNKLTDYIIKNKNKIDFNKNCQKYI